MSPNKKNNQRQADFRHRADINSSCSPSRPLRLRAQECLCSTRPVSKVGGANRLPALAGCTFCHEQQKVPKNALCVTFAALALRAPPKLTKPISETGGANRQPARAGLSRRRDARGARTADSFPCRGNVPGASISLREDDAGPCDVRRLRKDARTEDGSESLTEGGTLPACCGLAGRQIGKYCIGFCARIIDRRHKTSNQDWKILIIKILK